MAKDDDSLTSYLLKYADQKFAGGGAVQGYAVGGDVTRKDLDSLYQDYFGRGGDEEGLKHWQDVSSKYGLTLDDIGAEFYKSPEYQQTLASSQDLQNQVAGPGASRNLYAPTSDPSEWKTYYGYKPNEKDYTMLLRAGLGEYGKDDYNQYRGVYEALGNRAALGYRGARSLADTVTESQVEGAFGEGEERTLQLLRSKDPILMERVATARRALDDWLTQGQNRQLTTQIDWRGFNKQNQPSPGITRYGNPFVNRFVPGSDQLSFYNTFYDAEENPRLTARLAKLQNEKNAIWTAPIPPGRETDEELIARNEDVNPFDTGKTEGNLLTSNVLQNVGGQNINDTTKNLYEFGSYNEGGFEYDPYTDDTSFNPNITPGANTGLGFSTYDPNSFKVYRNDAIDQNAIEQNRLANTASNWQQDFNNVVGGQFNMSNPGLVGGYNSSNIGGFDYSNLGGSLGNVGAAPGFTLNTNYNFGDNSGFGGGGYGGGGYGGFGGGGFGMDYAEGGEVNFKKMFEGDSQAMHERARELAREAYSKGYSSLSKEKAQEWEGLARKYNLPLSVGPFDNYEDQYSDAVGKWQRGLSPKQREQTYNEGGPVKSELAVEELNNLAKILAGSNPEANVAPFELDLGGGSQARGRVVQAGPYIDVGGGITLPLRDVMLMLDASYGKVPGTNMKPNISVKGGLRIPFSEGGPVMPSTDSMGAYDTMTGLVGELPAKPVYEPSPRELLEARMSDQARSAMDLSGLALPDRAVDVKADEFGSYPVDAEGNRLKFLRRSFALPMVSGEGEARLAMPGFVEMAGNLMSGVAPAVKGSGAVLGSGPVRRGEKTLADLVDNYGVKKPGGNWIESSVDSKIDSLPALSASQDSVSSEALAKWADSKLKGYIKNQLGTVADPLIDVAEVTGKLHIPDEQIENLARSTKPTRGDSFSTGRAQTGYNPNLIGETDLSRSWEKLSQDLITRTKYKDLVYPETIPGMPVLPPESQVNKAFFTNRDLGFDHLTDELKNAMDPNSGLPRNLQIEPEKLERFSMKQAVEHVIKINDWREKTRAEANIKIAQNAATVPVKS